MKLTAFRRISPKHHHGDAIFSNRYIRDYAGRQSALGVTDFQTSSDFCQNVGFWGNADKIWKIVES